MGSGGDLPQEGPSRLGSFCPGVVLQTDVFISRAALLLLFAGNLLSGT